MTTPVALAPNSVPHDRSDVVSGIRVWTPAKIAWGVIALIASLKLLLHLWASGSYGYFRDELYYIACGRHLDWGYVDQPPLVALYARVGEWLGPSLRGFRLLATVVGALRVVLTGVVTARLGGGKRAQLLACAAVAVVPVYLALDGILTMNAFEHVFVLGALLILIEIVNGASEKWWLAFGAVAGIGLQNKHSMAFFGAAIVAAMILTPLRRSFARPWIWLGGLLAFLIFLPNLIWEVQHDFATLELLRNVKESGKNVVLPPGPFMLEQAMMLNPFAAPIWVAGLFALFFHRDLRRYRVLAWTYFIVLTLFIVLEAKDYYVAPIYTVLFAAGAVWWSQQRRLLYASVFSVAMIGGAIGLPLALPILSPAKVLAYQHFLGFKPPKQEVSHTSELPQLFSDQLGWEEMVAKVARYYNSLPPDVRAKTAIYTGNYGEAGAIDFYGPKYGLPPAISGHQNYFLWGPRNYTGESVILIEDDADVELWQSIREVDRRYHPYAMPEENGPIFHGQGLKVPLAQIWPKVKHWR